MVRWSMERLVVLAVLLTALGCGRGAAPESGKTPETNAEARPEKTANQTKAPPDSVVDETPREPATVAIAAKLLDLRKFTLPEGAS